MIRNLFLLFLIAPVYYAQINSVNFGAGLGFGEIKGNSPTHMSLQGRIHLETRFSFTEPVSFRFGYLYAQKYERFLPGEDKSRYFPFLQVFSLLATIKQPLEKNFFLKEGVGIISINDRTYPDTNIWSSGVAFNFSGNINLKQKQRSGFTLGLAVEYGITFNNTTPRYYSFMLQTEYYLF